MLGKYNFKKVDKEYAFYFAFTLIMAIFFVYNLHLGLTTDSMFSISRTGDLKVFKSESPDWFNVHLIINLVFLFVTAFISYHNGKLILAVLKKK